MLQFRSLLAKEKVNTKNGSVVIPTVTVQIPLEGVKKAYKTISLNDKVIELLGYGEILPTTKICIDFGDDDNAYLVSEKDAITLGFPENSKYLHGLSKKFTVNNSKLANELIKNCVIEDNKAIFVAMKVIDKDITVPVLRLVPTDKEAYSELLTLLESGDIDETYFEWENLTEEEFAKQNFLGEEDVVQPEEDFNNNEEEEIVNTILEGEIGRELAIENFEADTTF